MTEDDDWTTQLVPVSEWVFNRYKVTFTKELYYFEKVLYFVCTENHLEHAVQEKCDDLGMQRWKWEVTEENVPGPERIGTHYNIPIHADGWE